MEINSTGISFIKTAADIANKLGIEKLLFDVNENQVRGLHPDRTVAIISSIPENCNFGFKMMGIYRLNIFLARLNLMNGTDHKVTFTLDKDENVQQIFFKKKGLNVEYRCASPKIIKAPKKTSDVFVCEFDIDEKTITEAQRIMGAMNDSTMKDQTINISNTKSDEISFLISDTVHDTTEFIVSSEYKIINENFQSAFIFKYPMKLLMTFLKQPQSNTENKKLTLGQRGVLKSTIQGITVILIPSV